MREGLPASLQLSTTHTEPTLAGQESIASLWDTLHATANVVGRVHGRVPRRDAETLQGKGLRFCTAWFTDAFDVNNFVNAIGQIGFWVEWEDV